MPEAITLTYQPLINSTPSVPNSLRLDRFIADNLKGVSRAYLKDYFAEGRVQINGKPAEKSLLLKESCEISIQNFVWPWERALPCQPELDIPILFDHRDFMILNKPSGIASHALTPEDLNTVANFIVTRFPQLKSIGPDPLRPAIVHRLDTDTSGCLIVAKTLSGYETLRDLFKNRNIHKVYKAISWGAFPYLHKTISIPIAHHPRSIRKMVAAPHPDDAERWQARDAITHITREAVFLDHALLKVVIETGRRHQIRVHLAYAGFPISGDPIYRKQGDKDQDWLQPKRTLLHAHELSFEYEGELIHVTAPIPTDFLSALEKLKK